MKDDSEEEVEGEKIPGKRKKKGLTDAQKEAPKKRPKK